jgi:hypothetical protein
MQRACIISALSWTPFVSAEQEIFYRSQSLKRKSFASTCLDQKTNYIAIYDTRQGELSMTLSTKAQHEGYFMESFSRFCAFEYFATMVPYIR